MARPERNTVDYFPHKIGSGKKISYIRKKYKNDGYAVWFTLLEILAKTELHYLNFNNEEDLMFASSECFVTEQVLISIINDLVKLKVFDEELWQTKIIWCPEFIESIQDAYERRNNNCINYEGLCIHLVGLGVHLTDYCNKIAGNNTQSKVKYSKEELINIKKGEFKKTIEPHVEKYGKELCNKFFAYWVEPNKSKTKLRFELQQTWDVKGRLNTFAKNDKQFTKKEPVQANPLQGTFSQGTNPLFNSNGIPQG